MIAYRVQLIYTSIKDQQAQGLKEVRNYMSKKKTKNTKTGFDLLFLLHIYLASKGIFGFLIFA